MVPWKENDVPGEKEHRKENVLYDITNNDIKLNQICKPSTTMAVVTYLVWSTGPKR